MKKEKLSIPWILATIIGLALWIIFGSIPFLVYKFDIIEDSQWQYLGTIGDMFGSANALFSGLALIAVVITLRQQQRSLVLQHEELVNTREELELTRHELKESANAQQEMAKHQNNAISLQVILPLIGEIGSEKMRRAIIKITDFKRQYGEDDGYVSRYGSLLEKRRTGSLSGGERKELEDIDQARRRYTMFFHKIYSLSVSGVVHDNIVRIVVDPDSVYILVTIVEKLEASIRSNYDKSIFTFARGLYTEDCLTKKGAHIIVKKANIYMASEVKKK